MRRRLKRRAPRAAKRIAGRAAAGAARPTRRSRAGRPNGRGGRAPGGTAGGAIVTADRAPTRPGAMTGMHPRIVKALNEQLGAELYAAHLYLSMSAYFQAVNLRGFAHWMRLQSREEYVHAMKIYDYLNERDGRVILDEIIAPPTEWSKARAAFEDAYRHEQSVTIQIGDLVELSVEVRDYATGIFLQWFVTEQVEEEGQAKQILEQFDIIGDERNLLFLLDRELATRSAAS